MLIRLHNKNGLAFSLIMIGAYIVLFSFSDHISEILGVYKSVTAVTGLLAAALLLLWVLKHGLGKKYGLVPVKPIWKENLCFLPLVLLAAANFLGGIELKYSFLQTAAFIVSMLAVGILEEIIFRGFLFKALLSKNEKMAIIISSVTFGFGHVINLLNGAELFETVLQICYASAAGFLFTVIFYKTGSIIPCIAAHCAVNALSAFAGEYNQTLSAIVLIAVSLAYAIFLLKKYDKNKTEFTN